MATDKAMEPALRFPEFSGEWRNSTIQSLIDGGAIVGHLDGNHGELYPKTDEFSAEGVPYISANDLVDGRVNFSKCKRLPAERAARFKKGIAKTGDLLFAHNATVGPTAILKTNLDYVILSTTVTYFRFNIEKYKVKFAQAAFNSSTFIRQYSRVMSQSTRDQVPISAQRKFTLPVPSLREQKKIADFLTAIDERTALLRRRRDALRDYKKGMMQRLFSQDLRFTRDDGSQFPDWERKRLKSLCSVRKGVQVNRDTLNDADEFPVINGGMSSSGFTKSTNSEGQTITVSEGGNSCGYVAWQTQAFWLGGHCYALEPFLDIANSKFLFQILKHNQPSIMRLRVGSGLPNIQKGDLLKLDLTIPHLDEQQKISNFLSAIDAKIDAAVARLDAMVAFKKALLQQMFV
ncbi:restriction endonuclease subunit S [Parasphingorhabdus sp. DH2-15]|uniref:restriction endonuclease subunit S n=1 Tax=Parasphingorhabdus sp. DH2-15 TaxID=3444112 RepID=UPI003F688A27